MNKILMSMTVANDSELVVTPEQSVGTILVSIEQQFIAADLYFGHGTDNAWDDAVVIVLYVLQLPIDADRQVASQLLTIEQQQRILSIVKQRLEQRIPVPYLIHRAWFCGLSFYIDQRVLIPRSPLAELIEQQFQPWATTEHIKTILDMGTGSACIAIACAVVFPQAAVDAVDIDQDALDVAKLNITRHELLGRVIPLQSDLFDQLPAKKYDIIVSNPPYVDAEDVANLPPEYHHEPQHALASGVDGLDHCKRLLQQAIDYLNEDGILIVEVGNSRQALEQQFPCCPFVWLEFEYGGDGVFLLTYAELNDYLSRHG